MDLANFETSEIFWKILENCFGKTYCWMTYLSLSLSPLFFCFVSLHKNTPLSCFMSLYLSPFFLMSDFFICIHTKRVHIHLRNFQLSQKPCILLYLAFALLLSEKPLESAWLTQILNKTECFHSGGDSLKSETRQIVNSGIELKGQKSIKREWQNSRLRRRAVRENLF